MYTSYFLKKYIVTLILVLSNSNTHNETLSFTHIFSKIHRYIGSWVHVSNVKPCMSHVSTVFVYSAVFLVWILSLTLEKTSAYRLVP